jgi:excisionase family DNA binding protein
MAPTVSIMTATDRRYYTSAEVAEMFGIPVDAIRRRASRKEIPHIRVGRNWIRFSEENIAEIERMLRSRRSRHPRCSIVCRHDDPLSGPTSTPYPLRRFGVAEGGDNAPRRRQRVQDASCTTGPFPADWNTRANRRLHAYTQVTKQVLR